ncbi:MAG: cell surface protein SprA [Candidatus Cloacimonetes bacterium]|nr:cell surface protein SprA [Candidatus Cloacimonadota bacterium]
MNKTLLYIFIVLLNITYLFAESFKPEFYLDGVYPIKNSEIDIYKIPQGLSFTSNKVHLLQKNKQKTQFEISYDENLVTVKFKYNNIEIPNVPAVYLTIDEFLQINFHTYYNAELDKRIEDLLKDVDRSSGQGLIKDFVIKLPPQAVPRHLKKFLGGQEAARLSLNGSQKITFGYTHQKNSLNQNEDDTSGNGDFEMRSDLNLRLDGVIGQKINVNVTHNSNSDDDIFANPTEVKIWYEGFEDEIVKKVEGGDIAFTLSGTKFFSGSISSQGLFGVKTELEAGNLRVTSIFGKEESHKDVQEYTPGKSSANKTKRSYDFEKDNYFYMVRPDSLFEFYTEADTNIPSGWANNAIKLSSDNSLIVKDISHLPVPDSTIHVFLDDGTGLNLDETITGRSINLNDTMVYNFREIFDWTVDAELGIIRLNFPLTHVSTLGVVYYKRNDDITPLLVGNNVLDAHSAIWVKIIKIREQQDTDEFTGQYWDYSLRNVYSLGQTNIENIGFSLNFYDYNDDTSENIFLDPEIALGSELERYDQYLRLDTNYDDIINGDDRFVDLAAGTIFFPFLRPFDALEDTLAHIYDFTTVNTNLAKMNISITGQVGSDFIELPASNILPGSVSLTIDGSKLEENIDYMVDYDFGNITLLSERARLQNAVLKVNYEYKPIFSLDRRTLMGIRADLDPNENMNFGSTLIYQSEKVQEDRPKIGNENRSIVLADVDATLKYDPPILTKIVNWIPFIKTETDSKVELSAEVGMSIPKIYGNDKLGSEKEAYIDDMEAILESSSLGTTRQNWTFGSKPVKADEENIPKADMIWYNKSNVRAGSVYEGLTADEEKEDVTVLACKIDSLSEVGTTHWAGLMRYLGDGIDYSEKKYIQILVKLDSVSVDPVKMHINLGYNINEDFYTKDGVGNFNNEDADKNGQLDYDKNEDSGLDNQIGDDDLKPNEDGYNPDDDGDDDFDYKTGSTDYSRINGTEGNNKLDTEDLNRNGVLDQSNKYFDYSFDIYNDTDEYANSEYFLSELRNNWHLFRIPFNTDFVTEVNEPDLGLIRYARIWFETKNETMISLIELDVIGNKWVEDPIVDAQGRIILQEILDANDESIELSVIDNQRNKEHYTSPRNTVLEKKGEETLEQSLLVDYRNLLTGHKGYIHQQISDPTSSNTSLGINLLSYDSMKFWVYLEYPDETFNFESEQEFFFRLGFDEQNYYEIKQIIQVEDYHEKMLQNSWHEIEFSFSDISSLKIVTDGEIDSLRYDLIGNPTLSNIKFLYAGINSLENFNGRLYLNDIRVANPYEEIGFAAQAYFSSSFADFSDFSVDIGWQTPNFQQSAKRDAKASLDETKNINISNSYSLGKFFPAAWSMQIPLRLTKNYSIGIPLYQSNSDILREDLSEEDKKRQKNESLVQIASVNFSKGGNTDNFFMKHTLNSTTISSRIERNENISPTRIDTTMKYGLEHKYDLNFPKDSLSVKLFKDYRFYFFPNKLSNRINFNLTQPKIWQWNTNVDSTQTEWRPTTNNPDTKTVDTSSSITYDILSDFMIKYDLNTNRDLMLENYWQDIPIGQEKNRTQKFHLDYSPNYIDRIVTTGVTGDINYKDSRKKTTISDTMSFTGDNSRSARLDLGLKNKDILENWISKLTAKKENNENEKQDDPPNKDDNQNENKEFDKNRDEKELDLIEKTKFEEDQDKTLENVIIDKSEIHLENDTEQIEEQKLVDVKENKNKNLDTPEENVSKNKTIKNNKNILVSILENMARFDNISFSYTNSYRSNYRERLNRPDFIYQLGLEGSFPTDELDKRTYENDFSASSGVRFFTNLTTSFSYSLTDKVEYVTGRNEHTISTSYPNLNLRLSGFEKIINKVSWLDSLLESSSLDSRFNLTNNKIGELNSTKYKSDRTTYSLNPLLSWTANWINNFTTKFTFNFDFSRDISEGSNTIEKTLDNRSATSNISYSFSAPGGMKIPFIGDKIRFKNKLTTDIGLSWEKTYGETDNKVDINTTDDRWSIAITPGVSYEFSDDITGGFNGRYEKTDNTERNTKTSLMNFSMWVEIKF